MTRQGSSRAQAPPFTVLMPLWRGDRPDRLELALRTATLDQQLPPDLLILTIDGPLPAELETVVEQVEAGAYGPARVLRHDAHRGVAYALQDGLESSPHDLIARADADDICRPERFALQIPRMDAEGLDLLLLDARVQRPGRARNRPSAHPAAHA